MSLSACKNVVDSFIHFGKRVCAVGFNAFGWDAVEVDGHDIDEISSALIKLSDKPRAIIANTIKGKGISFMEDDNNWHYRIPTMDEVKMAFSELSLS